MVRLFASALFALSIAHASLSAAAPTNQRELGSTDRSVVDFADCFISRQHRAGQPFAYVLNGTGVTFATLPGADGFSPYYLSVREDGTRRRIALEGQAPAATMDAIRRCMV